MKRTGAAVVVMGGNYATAPAIWHYTRVLRKTNIIANTRPPRLTQVSILIRPLTESKSLSVWGSHTGYSSLLGNQSESSYCGSESIPPMGTEHGLRGFGGLLCGVLRQSELESVQIAAPHFDQRIDVLDLSLDSLNLSRGPVKFRLHCLPQTGLLTLRDHILESRQNTSQSIRRRRRSRRPIPLVLCRPSGVSLQSAQVIRTLIRTVIAVLSPLCRNLRYEESNKLHERASRLCLPESEGLHELWSQLLASHRQRREVLDELSKGLLDGVYGLASFGTQIGDGIGLLTPLCCSGHCCLGLCHCLTSPYGIPELGWGRLTQSAATAGQCNGHATASSAAQIVDSAALSSGRACSNGRVSFASSAGKFQDTHIRKAPMLKKIRFTGIMGGRWQSMTLYAESVILSHDSMVLQRGPLRQVFLTVKDVFIETVNGPVIGTMGRA